MRDIIFIRENVRRLIQQLYPTGRAWQGKDDSLRERDVKADSISDYIYELETFIATILPDNDMFNNNDATNWERRIGLDYDPETLTLDERKAEIIRKLSFPGGFKHTLTLDFLEYQLRASSFDIHVYPNLGLTQPAYTELVANSVDKEDGFTINNFHHSFIIAGETINTQAIIESRRRNEFIRKILKYKPMNMVCILNSTVSKQDGTFQLKYSDYICELIQETAPYATNVSISGIYEVGKTLTGAYIYNDDEGDAESGTTFKWYRADDQSGTNAIAIPGATGSSYELQSDDATKYISIGITVRNIKSAGEEVLSAYEEISPIAIPVITSFADGSDNMLTWVMPDGTQSSGTWIVERSVSPGGSPWVQQYGGGSSRLNVLPTDIYDRTLFFRVRRISEPDTEYSNIFSSYVEQIHNFYNRYSLPCYIVVGEEATATNICGEASNVLAENIYLQGNFTPRAGQQIGFKSDDGIVRAATRDNLIEFLSTGPTGTTAAGIRWIRFTGSSNVWDVDLMTGMIIGISRIYIC